MLEFFRTIFSEFIFRPELNLLYFFYQFTNDIGVSIVILALVVNLIMWPLYAKSYLNGQKTRLLQPQIKAIREKYKDDPQVFLKKLKEFNTKHNISSASTFYTLIAQLLFASGLFFLTRDISEGGSVDGLYENIFSTNLADFSPKAFGVLNITDLGQDVLILPILTAISSHLFGRYTTDWAPKIKPIKVEPPKKAKKGKKEEEKKEPLFDPEDFQQKMGFNTKYLLPGFLFFINISWSVGVNIYFLTTSILSLLRQISVSQYYNSNLEDLNRSIAESDPEVDFDNSTGELVEVEDRVKIEKKTKSVVKKKSSKRKAPVKKKAQKKLTQETTKKTTKKKSKKS